MEDIFGWDDKYYNVNMGIVTGKISKLAVIDMVSEPKCRLIYYIRGCLI